MSIFLPLVIGFRRDGLPLGSSCQGFYIASVERIDGTKFCLHLQVLF